MFYPKAHLKNSATHTVGNFECPPPHQGIFLKSSLASSSLSRFKLPSFKFSRSKKSFCFSFVLASLLLSFSGEIAKAEDTSCLLGGADACASLVTTPENFVVLSQPSKDTMPQRFDLDLNTTSGESLILTANKAVIMAPVAGGDVSYGGNRNFDLRDSVYDGNIFLKGNASAILKFSGNYEGEDLGSGAVPNVKGYALVGNITANNNGETHITFDNAKMKEKSQITVGLSVKNPGVFTGKFSLSATNGSEIGALSMISGTSFEINIKDSKVEQLFSRHMKGTMTLDNSTLGSTTPTEEVKIIANNHSTINRASIMGIDRSEGLDITLNSDSTLERIEIYDGRGKTEANDSKISDARVTSGGLYEITLNNSTLEKLSFIENKDKPNKTNEAKIIASNASKINEVDISANGIADITFVNPDSSLGTLSFSGSGGTAKLENVAYTKPIETTTEDTKINIYMKNSTLGVAPVADESGKIPAPTPILNAIASGGVIKASFDNTKVYGNISWTEGSFGSITDRDNGIRFTNGSELQGNIQRIQKLGDSTSLPAYVYFENSTMAGDIIVDGNLRTNKTPGELAATFQGGKFSGGLFSDGTNAKFNIQFERTQLDIANIGAPTVDNKNSKITINASGGKIGLGSDSKDEKNIQFQGILDWNLSGFDLGNITNTNADSKIILKDTQGHTYGDIGSSGSTYNGTLIADFDFTPITQEDGSTGGKNLTIGNITLGSANKQVDLKFSFGGFDGKKAIGALESPVTIKGGHYNSTKAGDHPSKFTFSNLGELDFSNPATKFSQAIKDKTNIDFQGTGEIYFEKTNITLASSDSTTTKGVNSVFSIGTTQGAIAASTPVPVTSKALGATFGNAHLEAQDDRFNLIGSKKVVANEGNTFYRLINKPTAPEVTKNGFVANQSSNSDIGYKDDKLTKDIAFVFTPGTFRADEQGYTGTILGGTNDSRYSFYNAGMLKTSQIVNATGKLNLFNTLLSGVLGQTQSGAKTDVTQTFDYSGNPASAYGLGIVGGGTHKLAFDFTGNTNPIKFAGSILGGSDKSTDASKQDGSDNTIAILNLQGLDNTKANSNVQVGTNKQGILNALNNAGFSAINDRSDATTAKIANFGSVSEDDKKDIVKGTRILLRGSSFKGNLIENDYSLDLPFSSTGEADPHSNNDIQSARFFGDSIDLSNNPYEQKLTFSGKDVISNANHSLKVDFGSGYTNFQVSNTNANFILKLNSGEAYISVHNIDGFVALSNTSSVKKTTNTELGITNTSLIGDWNLGGVFSFGDNTSLDRGGNSITHHSKFYGVLSNTTDSDNSISLTLNPHSLYSASDSDVATYYEGALKADGSLKIPTIEFKNPDETKNILILNNPEGALEIKGLSDSVRLSSKSSLSSDNTTIIGDLYLKASKLNLSFDSSKGNYYQVGTNNTIDGFASDSSLSFVGKGSLRSKDYNYGNDSGSITIKNNSQPFWLNANNTGAKLILNTTQDTKIFSGTPSSLNGYHLNIRGTNLEFADTFKTNGKDTKFNFVFAKASEATQDNLLKTSDGSLLTNSTGKNINDYVLSSSLDKSYSEAYFDGEANFTFFGDESLGSLDNSKTSLGDNASLNINLINMGDAFTTDNAKLDKALSMATVPSKSRVTYTIAGTNIKDLNTKIPTGINNATLNATFDTRDLNARDTDNQKYYTNSNAMGNTQLEIAKSKLTGNVTLDDNITANLVFLGKDALSDTSKISSGDHNSRVVVSEINSFDFNNFKNFKGDIHIFNPASIKSDLEDKAGGTGALTSLTTPVSVSKIRSLNIVFNAAKEKLKPTEDFDAFKVSGTASVDYYTKSTPYLSQDALGKIQTDILSPTHNLNNTIAIDLNTDHIMNQQIGYTTSKLNLTFIGAESIEFDGTNSVIHDANYSNTYNFVDFGKIDPKLFKDQNITGHINWMGRTWQTGTIQNGLSATIDLANLPDPEIAKNIYEAKNGIQRVTFNFGGSVLDNIGNYKMSGSIKQGDKTQYSTYSFDDLGTIDIPTLTDKDGNPLAGKDFYDVLNATINKENPVLAQTSGSLGISNTSVNGDVIWNTTDSAKKRTMEALGMIFSNITPLRGTISGDGQKSVIFFGNASFDKDIFKITETNKLSTYEFRNVGNLNTATISHILEGNSGYYIFGDSTILNGDITPNATDQTIDIGAIVRGEGNTLAKIETTSQVKALFGVGSRVEIKNKNAKSIYDFSVFKGSATPVVATINLDMNATKPDGIEKASVKGFDGGVSLNGSIQDSNQTFETNTITSDNTYRFSDKASWLMNANSKIAKLQVFNTAAEQNAALYAPTFANVGSVVDLRGARTQEGSFGGGAILGGAILAGATGDSSSSFTPHTLEIQNANLNGAIFRLGVDSANSQADKVIVRTVSADSYSSTQNNLLQVYLQNRDIPIEKPILLAQVDNGDKDFFKGAASLDGIYKITPIIETEILDDGNASTPTTLGGIVDASSLVPSKYQYFLTSYLVSAVSDYTDLLTSTLGTFYRGFRVETNNLNLRMGELRNNPSTQGVWARVINGMGSDDLNNQDLYTTLQAGYDYQLSVIGGRNYIGVSADASLIFSKGDNYTSNGRNLALGIYDTYLMDNGFYIDSLAKYINLSNRLSIKDSSILNDSTSTLYSNAFLLGVELGYRYSLDNLFKSNRAFIKGFYIEPQAELIYGYITGANYQVYMNNNTINASLEDNNALISRVGAVLGKRFKTTSGFEADIRLGLSYINELNSGGNVVFIQDNKTLNVSTPMNNKLNLSLGTNLKVSEDWRVYADISRTFLGVYNFDYNLNLGARFSFGRKISALEQSIQNNKAKQNKEAKAKAKLEKELKIKQDKEAKIKAKEEAKAKAELKAKAAKAAKAKQQNVKDAQKNKSKVQDNPSKAKPKQQNTKNTQVQTKDKNASKTTKK